MGARAHAPPARTANESHSSTPPPPPPPQTSPGIFFPQHIHTVATTSPGAPSFDEHTPPSARNTHTRARARPPLTLRQYRTRPRGGRAKGLLLGSGRRHVVGSGYGSMAWGGRTEGGVFFFLSFLFSFFGGGITFREARSRCCTVG